MCSIGLRSAVITISEADVYQYEIAQGECFQQGIPIVYDNSDNDCI